MRDFLIEAFRMKNLHHPNVMKLIGICWSPNPEDEQYYRPLLLLPYMVLQDLKTYLRKQRVLYSLSSAANDEDNKDRTRNVTVALGLQHIGDNIICL